MSKSSKVIAVTNAANLITAEQYAVVLDSIAHNTSEAKASIKLAAVYISQQNNRQAQQSAAKKLAKVYAAMMQSINGKEILEKSAMQWVWTQCKALDKSFKIIASQSEAAQKKAKSRAKKVAKAKELEEAAKPTVKPKESPISQYRTALIEKELNLQNEFRGVIPSAKVKEFDAAFAAFVETIKIILA